MRRIIISEGHKQLHAYDVEAWRDGHTVTMGRSERTTWYYPEFDEISRHHLSIRKHGDDLYLRDEATVNGTYVDDVALTYAVRMRAGVAYRVGRLLVHYEGEPSEDTAELIDCDAVFPEEYSFAMFAEPIVGLFLTEPSEAEGKKSQPTPAVKESRRGSTHCRAKKKNKRGKDRVRQLRQRQQLRQSSLAALFCATLICIIALTLYTLKLFQAARPVASFELSYVAEEQAQEKKREPKKLETRRTAPAPAPAKLSVPITVSPISQPIQLTPSDMGEFIGQDISAIGDGDGLGGDGLGGDGWGAGDGAGLGSAEEIASAFVGEFWDLKRKPNKSKSEHYSHGQSMKVHSYLSQFFNQGWPRSRFSDYLKSPVKLYATCFYMPHSSDLEATHAYDPTGIHGLEKSRWVIIYRAQVQAPKTGQFRFVGAADSVMGVRFNKTNVLHVGLHNLRTGVWGDSDTYDGKHTQYRYKKSGAWNTLCQGFTAGDIFHVKKGEWYDMEVLISEIGGGNFGFCLLIDELVDGESTSMKTTRGSITWGNELNEHIPVFQLFRTQLVEPNADEIYDTMKHSEGIIRVHPEYDEDSYVWLARTRQLDR